MISRHRQRGGRDRKRQCDHQHPADDFPARHLRGEPAGEGVADAGDDDRRKQEQIADRKRAAALPQRKRDHQCCARERGDPEQRPRPFMGDHDRDQGGRDRHDPEHHAAMRGIDGLHPHRHQERKQDGDAEHRDRPVAATARAAAAGGAARPAIPASIARRSACAARSVQSDQLPRPRSASPAACRRKSARRQNPATDRDARVKKLERS